MCCLLNSISHFLTNLLHRQYIRDYLIECQDIEKDVFLENPSDGAWGYKREKAANMKAMLHEGGKIYVVHNNDDKALKASIVLNLGRARIGAEGAYDVRPDMSDVVVNIDAKSFTDKDEDPDDDRLHSYHFEDWAVQIYCHPEKYRS